MPRTGGSAAKMISLATREPASEVYKVSPIPVPLRDWAQLDSLVGEARVAALRVAADDVRQKLDGRVIWNVSSTAEGGGVAEMLHVLVGYCLGLGFDVRWLVMSGDGEFFAITKRLHNRLHGASGDGDDLGPAKTSHYAKVTAETAQRVLDFVRPGDIVLLHDPQTAGMATILQEAGARVVWRCHVGREERNEWTEQAWSLLRGHLGTCEAFVFSVSEYVPPWMDQAKVWIIPPSIDPFSPKNEEIDGDAVSGILHRIGLFGDGSAAPPVPFTRRDGTTGYVSRHASIVMTGKSELGPHIPLVVQVSRWDRLKDMAGVMQGFADHVPEEVEAHLALVGPSPNDVSDDPEELEVYRECVAAWNGLPDVVRRRVHLVALPMDDMDENAAMVNAIQRHATVVVQKSLAEGFGLTVAEAMWKSRAVIASGVGGIVKQVVPGTGILLAVPTDLRGFGEILVELLTHPEEIALLGAQARQHVLDEFVGDRHLGSYAKLIASLL
ncbi:MAG TPA: glycosyltransferase [Acidimicrobiales bacterium]|nr:glycosyltransferase [Acidimicrobiales bacterium]